VLPDVPTVGELGIKNYTVTTWYALWAIKGTPQPIVDRMFEEMAKALQAPEIKEIWAAQGAAFGGMPPKEFDALVKSEIARWGKVVKDSGVRIDN
jgi:tripartite-type tricarboxylate transporter receptor subunit TctC